MNTVPSQGYLSSGRRMSLYNDLFSNMPMSCTNNTIINWRRPALCKDLVKYYAQFLDHEGKCMFCRAEKFGKTQRGFDFHPYGNCYKLEKFDGLYILIEDPGFLKGHMVIQHYESTCYDCQSQRKIKELENRMEKLVEANNIIVEAFEATNHWTSVAKKWDEINENNKRVKTAKLLIINKQNNKCIKISENCHCENRNQNFNKNTNKRLPLMYYFFFLLL